MITEDNVREELISHLKTRYINNDINRLWGETKSWFKDRLIEMGGSYASFGKDISVRAILNKKEIEFKVSLKEVD